MCVKVVHPKKKMCTLSWATCLCPHDKGIPLITSHSDVHWEMCRRSSQLNLKPKHCLWTHSRRNEAGLSSRFFWANAEASCASWKNDNNWRGFGGGRLEMARALLKRKAWSPDRLVTGCEWSTWVLWLSRRTPDSVWALKQCHHQRPGLTAI